MIVAQEVNQRLSLTVGRAHNFAEKDHVVAGFHRVPAPALDGDQDPGQQRRAGGSRLPVKAIEAAFRLLRKTNRQAPLALFQNVDGEVVTCSQVRQRGHRMVHCDQNQGRIQGYGSE